MSKKKIFSNIPYNLILDIFHESHDNGVELLYEARILFNEGRFSRSYFLSFTGLEEIAKSQLAADVLTGQITIQKFNDYVIDHKKKISSIRWATLDVNDIIMTKKDAITMFPSIQRREGALYVGLVNNRVTIPSNLIKAEDAATLMDTLSDAIGRIAITEELQGRIGIKGFMK